MKRRPIVIEIGVYIFFTGFITLLQLLFKVYFVSFKESDTIDRTVFNELLLDSFIIAFVVCTGLFVLYFINKKRVAKGKKPL